jgi:nucleoside-diphosphate-sugar epimerase
MSDGIDRPRVLVIGGSGLVGSLIVPDLTRDYRVRVLDPVEPKYDANVEHVVGGSTDYEVLARSFGGIDCFIYLAMGPKDPAVWERPELAALQFDMAVKGVYLACRAAAAAGVSHGVYASSMSVFAGYPSPDGPIGDIAPDQTHFYGLAKRLGEEVLRAAVRTSGMSVIALRLCHPMSDADWLATEDPLRACIGTAGTDVSSAFRAALRRRGHGFEAVAISGDRHSRYADISLACDLLGWQPAVRHPLSP